MPAQEKIADLIDYNGKIVVYLKGDELPLPKPVKVNGTAVTEEYLIQNGDEIAVASVYTYDEFFEYMGLSPDDMILFINGERADKTMEVKASDQLEFKNRKEYELKEIYKESNIELHSNKRREARRQEKSKAEEVKAAEEPTAAEEKPETDEAAKDEPENGADAVKTEQAEPEDKTEETKAEPENDEAVKTEPENKEETAPEPEDKADDEEQAEPEPAKETVKEDQTESESVIEDTKEEPAKEPEIKAAEKTEQRDDKKIPETKEKEEPPVDSGKKIIVIVNQKPVVMRGKQSYMFVDIFDYIDFDTSRMQGSGIATLVNGKDAQYTQELYNGDKIEVYWK